jgi:hypothetical protein
MGKKSGSGIQIRDEQPRSYFRELRNHFFGIKILKFFDADPRSGIRDGKNLDPGWKKLGSGIRNTAYSTYLHTGTVASSLFELAYVTVGRVLHLSKNIFC